MAFGANQGFMIAFYDTLKALIENVIELIFGLKVKIKKYSVYISFFNLIEIANYAN